MGQDLSCTYLAHHQLESTIIIIITIIIIDIAIIIILLILILIFTIIKASMGVQVDPDKAFAVQIKHEESVLTGNVAYMQCAVLFSSSNGERRIRCIDVFSSSSS